MKKKELRAIVQTIDALGAETRVMIFGQRDLKDLIKRNKLYPTDKAAKMFGLTIPYVRRLCKAGIIDAERILGRYYFTPKQIASLQRPIRGASAAFDSLVKK